MQFSVTDDTPKMLSAAAAGSNDAVVNYIDLKLVLRRNSFVKGQFMATI